MVRHYQNAGDAVSLKAAGQERVLPVRRLRVLVFLDQARAVTNFVASGAFKQLIERHDLGFVVPPFSKRMGLDPAQAEAFTGLEWHTLDPDRARANAWGRLAMLHQLRWRPGDYWHKMRRLRRVQMAPKERVVLTLLALPGIVDFESRRQRRLLAKGCYTALEELLDREKPDIAIHPSALNGVYVNDLVLACRARNIPSVVIMNSWDNPSTKNTVEAHPDRFLVWGKQTADHAVRYMGIARERVVVMGAAQFDVYSHPPAFDRAATASGLGFDPARPILLYGASSILAGDYVRLKAVDAWCRNRGADAPQILYRPYPWRRLEGEITAILDEPWSHVRVQKSALRIHADGDLGETALDRFAALNLADAVISPLSTILLEGLLLDRPVLCIYPEGGMKLEFTPANAPLAHFAEIFSNPDVVMVRNDDEMAPGLDRLMAHIGNEDVRARMTATAREVVTSFDEPYAARLCAFVESMAVSATGEADAGVRKVRLP